MNTIGQKLRRLIEQKGITQVELAAKVGVSPSRLSNYLSDRRVPDVETLAKLAFHLSSDLNYFMDFTYPLPEEKVFSPDSDMF